jgi:hypothetical protein
MKGRIMKLNLRSVFLIVIVEAFAASLTFTAMAQCYNDSSKHTCFEISYVSAKFQTGCFGACDSVQDFLFAYTNPNVFASTGGNHENGYIWIKAKLDATDSTFEYLPTCNNPLPDGRCVDVYEFAAVG